MIWDNLFLELTEKKSDLHPINPTFSGRPFFHNFTEAETLLLTIDFSLTIISLSLNTKHW